MSIAGRLAPPIAVMALIYVLSAQPDLSTGLGTTDTILRKGAHMTIYAALWLSVARALDWRRPVVTTAICLAYAATDEYHQTFVHGRHGTPVDVAIDGVGMALAAAWLARRPSRASRALLR